MVFSIDYYGGADFCPAVELGDFRSFHVNTAVRHGDAEVVVPIGAVEAVADMFGNLVVVEKKNIWNIR